MRVVLAADRLQPPGGIGVEVDGDLLTVFHHPSQERQARHLVRTCDPDEILAVVGAIGVPDSRMRIRSMPHRGRPCR